MKKGIIIAVSALILILAIYFILKGGSQDEKNSIQESAQSVSSGSTSPVPSGVQDEQTNASHDLEKPQMQIDKNKKYTVLFSTTEGKITIELFADKTPITVNNFVYLARNKFYDKTIFHRVIKSFMIQGGDPKGDGTGGPGYKFDDEPFAGEYLRGIVAMANAGPNTNGSQFFIMHQDYPLSKNYVIFGKVVEGMEVVDRIADSEVKANVFGEVSTPVNPVKVESVEITEE